MRNYKKCNFPNLVLNFPDYTVQKFALKQMLLVQISLNICVINY